MRMTIDHPVIVNGTFPNGEARHELVRTPAEFEFRELSEAEAPLAFTDGIDRRSTRVIDGKLYRAWYLVNPASESLGENGTLRKSLFGGVGMIDFRSLGKLVQDAARQIEKADPFVQVANISRGLAMRDRKSGHTADGIVCIKAPTLKNWRWLSSDTQETVSEWRAITAELLDNVVVIGGRPYLRCFEPGFRVEYLGEGQASIHEASTGIYAREAHRSSYFDDGLEIVGPTALACGSHYFSATDPDGPATFAEQLGWRLCGKVYPIEVHEADYEHTDFLELETVRHARMLLDWAEASITLSKVKAPVPETPLLERVASELRSSILDWQAEKAGYASVAKAFHALRESQFAEALIVGRRSVQIGAFVTREDAAPVRITASSFGPSI
ncbi:hypothetical protein O9X98_13850 [Agrobacterium salinitolerans]|nr:hypothetical protein [Agrobacterium salinitolerans]